MTGKYSFKLRLKEKAIRDWAGVIPLHMKPGRCRHLRRRTLFVQFAEAIVRADNNEHPVEAVIPANFRDILTA